MTFFRKREIEKALAPVYTYDNSEVEVNDSFYYQDEENNRNILQEANGNQVCFLVKCFYRFIRLK